MSRPEHWEQVYATKGDEQLSWLQSAPRMSLTLIESLDPAPKSALDVGAGQSALAGALVARGMVDVTALDISTSALRRARERLGDDCKSVDWVVGDVLGGVALPTVDLWHDRAVYHFLVEEAERRRYVERCAASVDPGGRAIIATFASDGPEKCSGLPVRRADAAQLAADFATAFSLEAQAQETHETPWGKTQPFTYVVLRRESSADG